MSKNKKTNSNEQFEIYKFEKSKVLFLPFIDDVHISAGFPSPADDYSEKKLDLNEYLIKHPEATFFIRVKGNSMVNAGIHSADILIVDRALTPQNNNIIIAILDGEFLVKRIKIIDDEIYLMPENDDYEPIKINKNMDFEIWGVVTYVIHKV
ncbi:MAG TPA: translesion error-prone DNA polymerase V autoproteolytic subunit [bacterium]|nr:translesion error-prone DNA polymerase V autoproteolytic subunit [bacterium]HOL46938.1 translesion error-prone DNA polymerase V autoproteolytic subunit [bacterium]HPQ18204.1 translesion error-prone DNA polymerase V autoproteolytic subunit [bacterium]